MVNFIVFWKHFGNHISCNINYIVLSSLEQIVYFIVKPMFSIFSSKPRSHDKSPSMTFRTKIWPPVLMKVPKTVVKQRKWRSIMWLRHNQNQVEPSNCESGQECFTTMCTVQNMTTRQRLHLLDTECKTRIFKFTH